MNTLELFESAARSRFSYLETEFNLPPPDVGKYAYMRVLEYRGSQLAVCLNYEIGSLPWVTITRTLPGTEIRPIREAINLDVALMDAGVPPPSSGWVFQDVPDEVLVNTIQFQADVLKRLCTTFLRGEFDPVWSRLVTAQQECSAKRS